MADRSKLAAARPSAGGLTAERLTVRMVQAGFKPPAGRTAFRAWDGTVLVLVEADNEDEARAICAEDGFEFVSLCEE